MGVVSILHTDTDESLLRISSFEVVLVWNCLLNLTCLLSDSVEAVGVGDGATEVPGMSCPDSALVVELACRPQLCEGMWIGGMNCNEINHLQRAALIFTQCPWNHHLTIPSISDDQLNKFINETVS